MNEIDKNYIIDSLHRQVFLSSEIYQSIKHKFTSEQKLTELEKSLLILVIEHDTDLIQTYKKMLKKIVEKTY